MQVSMMSFIFHWLSQNVAWRACESAREDPSPCVFKLTWTLLPHPTPPLPTLTAQHTFHACATWHERYCPTPPHPSPPISQICILYCGFLGTCMVLVGCVFSIFLGFDKYVFETGKRCDVLCVQVTPQRAQTFSCHMITGPQKNNRGRRIPSEILYF